MIVYKYVIDGKPIEMPKGAKLLKVAMQGSQMTLWAMVDPALDTELRYFAVYGTGMRLANEKLEFIGTVFDSAFVWHVFERLV